MLLYGSGLRLIESSELRVKDIDFGYKQIVVRDSKGEKDRITMLPQRIIEPLKKHLCKAKEIHEEVFPTTTISTDPRSGIERRHHFYYTVIQKAVKQAIRNAGIVKQASCHTFRHFFATHLFES